MKLILAFLLSIPLMTAQSVVVKALNGVSSGTSSPLLNQGQTAHNVYAQYSGVGCSTSVGKIQLEASFDGTVYFGITSAPIGLTLNGSIYQGTVAVSAGPYPFLRVNQYSATANCTVTAWYSGASFTVSQPQMAQSSQGEWRYNVLSGSGTDDFFVPATGSRRSVLYAMAASNLSATDDLNIIVSADVTTYACADVMGIRETFQDITLAPGQTVIIPATLTPIGTPTNRDYYICAHLSGVSPNYSMSAVYRWEQ